VTPAVAIQLRKEFRELLPLWGGTVGVMLVCWMLRYPDAMPTEWLYGWALSFGGEQIVGLAAYAVGAVVLGASSIGQEYFHHTLETLLIQPVARRRLLLVKFGVLAPMLGSIGVVALVAFKGGLQGSLMLGVLPLVSGLCLAPWFTMMCRSAMAGAVFSAVALPLVLVAGVSLRLPTASMWPLLGAIAVVGAVMTWRTFLGLEVAGASSTEIHVSAFAGRAGSRARAGRTQHPLWLLLKKEARLQELTFVLTGLYVLIFAVIIGGQSLIPETASEPALYVTAFFQTGLVPILIGALASAEERRLGVTEWHVLLPFAAWKQWALKVGFIGALAYMLVVVLPTLLESMAGIPDVRGGVSATQVVMLSIAALYVSSLCSTGLRAFLATVPVMALALLVAAALISIVAVLTAPAVKSLAAALQSIVPLDRQDYYWWRAANLGARGAVFWIIAGFALLVLYAAFTNHRTADRGMTRLVKQGAWLAAYVVAAWLVLAVANTMVGIAIRG
jgi:ABC-type transport system involved in multi-copper enzyme maturation permease subunit